jgi:hypothetical protein
MSEQMPIELSEEAQGILRDLKTMPVWMFTAIAEGMNVANKETVAEIQRDHLTGQGPFPAEEHRLGVRSNRLRGAIWAAEPVINGSVVESGIGDNVAYAAIHEFGGRIAHRAKAGSVRLRTNAAGELLRQPGGRGAIFAKGSHKRVREVGYSSAGYEVVMPERAPIRSGIEEMMGTYSERVSEAITEAWEGQR